MAYGIDSDTLSLEFQGFSNESEMDDFGINVVSSQLLIHYPRTRRRKEARRRSRNEGGRPVMVSLLLVLAFSGLSWGIEAANSGQAREATSSP
jgi:hypothetical protein